MTLEQLNKIHDEYEDLIKVRKVIAEEGKKLAEKTGYRKQILVCGGTGCTSSGTVSATSAGGGIKLNRASRTVLIPSKNNSWASINRGRYI